MARLGGLHLLKGIANRTRASPTAISGAAAKAAEIPSVGNKTACPPPARIPFLPNYALPIAFVPKMT
jgi:hypothetical protein